MRATGSQPRVAVLADAQQLDEVERDAILQSLRKHDFNRTETARALGISRRALLYKLQRVEKLGYATHQP